MKNRKNQEGKNPSEKRDSPNQGQKHPQEIPEQPDSAYRFPKSGKQDIFGRSVPNKDEEIRPATQ